MLTELVTRRAPVSTESAAMVRYRLSKRLGVLVDHVDYLSALGANVEPTRGEIRRVLVAMSAIDELQTNGGIT
jgi:hypothetical protein